MRPLFAIAPLALLLALIGPTPHEANQALAAFKERFMSPKTPQRVESAHDLAIIKPTMAGTGSTFSAMHKGGVIEASFRP
ncbi:MAG: hypothetical protein EPO09_12145 [Aquabacterium sp.]|uniref:hypothetical protein n=1 Tax=Aquabacterium sp. TaxID=1872578 RepID=UPI0012076F6B|nr:hypothetical protein [Aquabacterium sp.]TAK93621.1 MAG: hypothetical protein EPO09_12145 [Aquabacterium sp.]